MNAVCLNKILQKDAGINITTEQYIITFFGIDTKYYTNDFVGRCWELAADEEYGSTGIYVTGTVTTHSLICGEIRGCQMGKIGHCVSAVRNPVEVADSGTYKKSLINVRRSQILFESGASSTDGQGVGGKVQAGRVRQNIGQK